MMRKEVRTIKTPSARINYKLKQKCTYTTQQNPCPTPFLLCVHVHKCRTNKGQKTKQRSAEGYPILNFKDSVTMTWNAWHAFMTPVGFCLDFSGSLSASEPQESIYMLNTASSGTELTQGAASKSNEFS